MVLHYGKYREHKWTMRKFPAESQYFFKHEKEERRNFLILIN